MSLFTRYGRDDIGLLDNRIRWIERRDSYLASCDPAQDIHLTWVGQGASCLIRRLRLARHPRTARKPPRVQRRCRTIADAPLAPRVRLRPSPCPSGTAPNRDHRYDRGSLPQIVATTRATCSLLARRLRSFLANSFLSMSR